MVKKQYSCRASLDSLPINKLPWSHYRAGSQNLELSKQIWSTLAVSTKHLHHVSSNCSVTWRLIVVFVWSLFVDHQIKTTQQTTFYLTFTRPQDIAQQLCSHQMRITWILSTVSNEMANVKKWYLHATYLLYDSTTIAIVFKLPYVIIEIFTLSSSVRICFTYSSWMLCLLKIRLLSLWKLNTHCQ